MAEAPSTMHAYPTRFLSLLLLLALLALPTRGQAFKTEAGHAEFESQVPLHSFIGSSDQLVGLINLADQTVDFYLDLTTLDTGIGKRDKDMRITLETKKYPFAEFFGKLVTPFDATVTNPQSATVRGKFTIHGVSREVDIQGTLQQMPDGLFVEAAWTLNLEDYDIVPPSLLIVKVDPEQDIRIRALLQPATL